MVKVSNFFFIWVDNSHISHPISDRINVFHVQVDQRYFTEHPITLYTFMMLKATQESFPLNINRPTNLYDKGCLQKSQYGGTLPQHKITFY